MPILSFDDLASSLPQAVIRAYADDIALVTHDLWDNAPTFGTLFKDFELASGLSLNIRKTVIVPLFEHTNPPPFRNSSNSFRAGEGLTFSFGPPISASHLAQRDERALGTKLYNNMINVPHAGPRCVSVCTTLWLHTISTLPLSSAFWSNSNLSPLTGKRWKKPPWRN